MLKKLAILFYIFLSFACFAQNQANKMPSAPGVINSNLPGTEPNTERNNGPPAVVMSPGNDDCSNATSITAGTTLGSETNNGAFSDGPTPSCWSSVWDNVWYKFTVPAGGASYSVTVKGGSIRNPKLAIIKFSTACSNSGATTMACNSINATGTSTSVSVSACLAAGTYYIDVDDEASSGTAGSFSITLTQTGTGGIPANDACSSPTSLITSVGTSGSNACASIAATDPTFCTYNTFGTAEASVWYQYTLAAAGNITLTLNGGTIQYPNISFYTAGTCGTASSFVSSGVCGSVNSGSTSTLTTSINCLAAGTYYIAITDDNGNGGSTGTFTITPTFTASSGAPVNDNCASAINLGTVSTSTTTTGTNICATVDQSPFDPSCFNYSANVWYKFTAAAGSSYSISVNAGTITYPAIEVYSGTCGSFTELACVSNHSGNTSVSSVANCLAAGTYYVAVDYDSHNGNGSQGTFSISINATSNCSGAPTGGTTISTLNSTTCGGSNNVTLSLSGNSTGCGITYQWQSSTNNSTWTVISGANSSTYNATVSSNTYYQCVLTCSNGGATNTSTSVLVSGSTTNANDNCANATAIPIAANTNIGSYIGTIAGTNACATADGSNSSCFTINQNVWYTFTAPVAGNYFVGITAGTMVYPEISILKGSCGALTESNCAGVNNSGSIIDSDHFTSTYGYSPFSLFGTSYSYGGICSVSAGGTVYVMVDNYKSSGGSAGTYTVTVATIINDDISTPLIINTCGTNFNSSTIGATNCGNGVGDNYYNNLDGNTGTVCSGSAGASAGDCSNGTASSSNDGNACVNGGDVGYTVQNDSWYEFCVTATSTITLTFAPVISSCLPAGTSNSALQISVFTGSVGSLTKVAGGYCNMEVTSSVVYTYSLTANQCTFIEVDGALGTNCDYSLNAAIIPTCVLSVDLIYFTGINEQGRIKLNWSSASETNAGRYVIERSSDGIDYKPVANIKATSNTTRQTDYSTYDEHPIMNGVNYYRLSEFDINSKGGVLAQTFVSNTGAFPHFMAYPNPSNGKVTISINNFAVPAVTVVIYDVYGRMAWTSDVNLDNGTSLQQVDLSLFEAGVYYIETSDGTNFYKQSLLISKNN
jgi:hypothetical protein